MILITPSRMSPIYLPEDSKFVGPNFQTFCQDDKDFRVRLDTLTYVGESIIYMVVEGKHLHYLKNVKNIPMIDGAQQARYHGDMAMFLAHNFYEWFR